MRAACRTIVASLLVVGAVLVSPVAVGAQDRPSDPNGCAETPAAEHCQSPGKCAETPGAEHCQKDGDRRDTEVLSSGISAQPSAGSSGGGLLSLPRTGAGIAALVAVALATIAAGIAIRRSADRA